MQVDPAELRALAQSMSDLGAQIEAIRTQVDTSGLDAGLRGSVLAQAGIAAGSITTDTWSRIASRASAVAGLIEASASSLQVADVEFADRIDTLGGGS
jgi:hypothetical protein